jgi:hypothetical protein
VIVDGSRSERSSVCGSDVDGYEARLHMEHDVSKTTMVKHIAIRVKMCMAHARVKRSTLYNVVAITGHAYLSTVASDNVQNKMTTQYGQDYTHMARVV